MATQKVEELTQDTDAEAIITEINALNEADGIPVNNTFGEEPEATATERQAPLTEEPTSTPPTDATPVETTPEERNAQVPEETRRLLAEQEQRIAYYQQVEQAAAVQRENAAILEQLDEQGYSPEQAQSTMKRIQTAEADKVRTQEAAEQYAMFLEGKMNAVLHFSEKYKVPAKSLMQHNTPQEMEAAAKQSSEMDGLKRQIAELRGKEVPTQTFEQGRQSAPTASEDRLVDSAMSKPREQRTEAESAALRRAAIG